MSDIHIDVTPPPAIQVVASTVGIPGPPGAGVPSGGTTGQVLAKASGADNDTHWVPAPTGGGSGGGPKGTTRADVWSYHQSNVGSSQSWPADGWDFISIVAGGPTLSIGPTHSHGASGDEVGLSVAEAGWYDARLFFEGQFSGSAPDYIDVGFSYAGMGSYNYPSWRLVTPPTTKHFYQMVGSYGPIKLAVGAEIRFTASWSTTASITGSQFAFDLTGL